MTKVLAIETSCDETSIAILDFTGERNFTTLAHTTLSQATMHAQYGGVYPAMAKREHQKNIIPLLFSSLKDAGLLVPRTQVKPLDTTTKNKLISLLDREPALAEKIILLAEQYKTPSIKAVSVTYGPGLEIALWTGFNLARALTLLWDATLIPTNHMEGHIYASLLQKNTISNISYPALALLISGGHTELVLIKSEHTYKIIGQTVDDAVGEAYDKSARLLGFDYPGGVLVSQQAELAKQTGGNKGAISLPRPMLHSNDYNFSFSGLKTAVLYLVQKQSRLSKQFKQQLCLEFEEAVAEVLVTKTKRALTQYKVSDLIVGGGVSANTNIRSQLQTMCDEEHVTLHLPDRSLSGDNALMVALAGFRRWKNKLYPKRVTRVKGNLSL